MAGGLLAGSACSRPAQAPPAAAAVTVAQPAPILPDLYAQPARGAFEKLAFSPDGTLLAGLTIDHSQIVLWDVVTGFEVRSMLARAQPPAKPQSQQVVYPPTAIAFSEDGRLVGGAVDTFLQPTVPEVPLQAWDVASGASAHAAGTFAFRRDGPLKIEARQTSPASVDLEVSHSASGASRGVLARIQHGIQSVSISADQHWLIALDGAGHVRLLDVRAGVELPRPAAIPDKQVTIAQFSPAGRYLLIVHRPQINVRPVTLVEPGTWRVVRELDRFPDPTWSGADAAFSADDSKVAVTLGAEPYLWETASGRKLQQFGSVGVSPATTVAFSPDGGWLGVGGSEDSPDFPFDVYNHEGVTTLWPLDGTAPRQVRHDRSVRALAFSPDGRRVAVATQHEVRESRASGVLEGSVEIANLSVPMRMQKLLDYSDVHPRSATSVAFVNDGKLLVAAVTELSALPGTSTITEFERSTRLGIWDSGTGALIREVDARQDALVSMTFSHDEKLTATADPLGANIWNVATPARRLRRVGGAWQPMATAVAFSPDGKRLIVGSLTLSLIDAETGATVRTLEEEKTRFSVRSLAFSLDGRTMASAACPAASMPPERPDAIRLWDTSSWATTGSVPVGACVEAMSFSADGRVLATVTSEGAATLWRVAGGKPLAFLATMRHGEDWVAWTPDARYDGSPNGVARLVAWRVGARALPLDRASARRVPGLLGLVMQGK